MSLKARFMNKNNFFGLNLKKIVKKNINDLREYASLRLISFLLGKIGKIDFHQKKCKY